jgi:integrase
LAPISKAHKAANLPSPVRDSMLISEPLKGVKRTFGTAQTPKGALLTDDLRVMLRGIPESVLGVRDRALLLLCFAGAFRRSEAVALDIENLTFAAEGVRVFLPRSKTDQAGQGRHVPIPFGSRVETYPVRALQAWIAAAAITEGALFHGIRRAGKVQDRRLTAQVVALVVKKYAKCAGLDAGTYSGHSLRAGFVTSAARAGEPERNIMQQTGHKSVEMVMRYICLANDFKTTSANALGL